ncbi:hypothetical protein ACMFWY_22805 [Roseiconus sp. JC912]|uniref:hypothetical protein n=2 Tax=Pirellulaceae TaxID=2691357 RepID=UPI003A4C71A5
MKLPSPMHPLRRGDVGRLAKLLFVGFVCVSGSSVVADTPETIQRVGRLIGVGWGDGYHTCRDGGCRPGADLPPASFNAQFNTPPACQASNQIYPSGTALPKKANVCQDCDDCSRGQCSRGLCRPAPPMPYNARTQVVMPPPSIFANLNAGGQPSVQHRASTHYHYRPSTTHQTVTTHQSQMPVPPPVMQLPQSGHPVHSGSTAIQSAPPQQSAGPKPGVEPEPHFDDQPLISPSDLDTPETLPPTPGSRVLESPPERAIENLPAPSQREEILLDDKAWFEDVLNTDEETLEGAEERSLLQPNEDSVYQHDPGNQQIGVQVNPYFGNRARHQQGVNHSLGKSVLQNATLEASNTGHPERLRPTRLAHRPKSTDDWNPIRQPQ